MQLSQRGLDFIKQWEGFRDRPYNDGYGGITIGYGHLIKPGERFTVITRAEGEQILAQDVAYYVSLVNSLVRVPLNQSQFDALVSLAFNWRGFPQSRLLQYLNAGDYAAAAKRLGEHPVTSGGVYSRGLQRRRTAEKELFLSEGTPGGSSSGLPESEYPDIGFDEDDDATLPTDEPSDIIGGSTSAAAPLLIGAGVLLLVFLIIPSGD
ncbi:MAG: Lysozyme RrrD [Candidatus Hydrogenedentes bacterium ADurb.Bin170]|nr:MAG: Lysozyme RrrD [Candidatus Hydrogenedentes bacterium ADurb.Bin170]